MFSRQRKALKEAKEKEEWKKQIDKQVEINKIQTGTMSSFEEAQKQYTEAMKKAMNQPVNQYGTSSQWMSNTSSTAPIIPLTNQPNTLSYYGQTYVPADAPKDNFVPKVWAVVKVTSDSNYNVAVFSSEQLADVYIKKLDMYNDKTEDCYYEVEEFIIDSNIEEGLASGLFPLQPEQ